MLNINVNIPWCIYFPAEQKIYIFAEMFEYKCISRTVKIKEHIFT